MTSSSVVVESRDDGSAIRNRSSMPRRPLSIHVPTSADGQWRCTFLRAHMRSLLQEKRYILPCRGSNAIKPNQFFRSGPDVHGFIPRMVRELTDRGAYAGEKSTCIAQLVSDSNTPGIILLTGPSGMGKTVEQLSLVHAVADSGVNKRLFEQFSRHPASPERVPSLANRVVFWVDCGFEASNEWPDAQRKPHTSGQILGMIAASERLRASEHGAIRRQLKRAELEHYIRHTIPCVFLFDLNRSDAEHSDDTARSLLAFVKEFQWPRNGSHHRRISPDRSRAESVHDGDISGAAHQARSNERHICIVGYRPPGQATGNTWGILPRNEEDICYYRLQDLPIEDSLAYLRAARGAIHSRRLSQSCDRSEIDAAVEVEMKWLKGILSNDFKVTGIALLMHFAAIIPDIRTIRSICDLYYRFEDEWLVRAAQSDGDAQGRTLNPQIKNRCRTMTALLAIELTLSGRPQLTLEATGSFLEKPSQLAQTYHWKAALMSNSELLTQSLESNDIAAFIEHGFVTVHSANVQFVHPSFVYYFAGRALRFESDGFFAPIETAADWAGRVLAAVKPSPERWIAPFEFLGGVVNGREMRQLIQQLATNTPRNDGALPFISLMDRVLKGMSIDLQSDPTLSNLSRIFSRYTRGIVRNPAIIIQEVLNELQFFV